MKVLMVISQFHPIIGGAERQAQLLAQTLIKKGIQVQVVTGWWKLRTPRREVINGVRIFRNFSFWGMFGIKGIRSLGALVYMITLGFYLLLHKKRYDVIHVHQVLYPAFISALVGKSVLSKPVIVKNSCTGLMGDIIQIKRFPLGDFQLKYLLKKTDCLIVVSKEGEKEFRDLGYPEQQITHIPNGVELPVDLKKQSEQPLRLLTSARLDRQKGVDVLLKAWANIVQEEKTHKLQILGSGPLKSDLQKLTETLKIEREVEFVGMVHNVEEYLKISDIFVLPSRAEGLSNALLEAMSYGIPCITTNVGGNNELFGLDGEKNITLGEYLITRNGLIINPDDIKGLSKAILYLIRNNKAREEIGTRSREFIQRNYSIDWVADRYIGLYRKIMEEKS
jgi:glycosyltransferase involved in cell wall biosynthesis